MLAVFVFCLSIAPIPINFVRIYLKANGFTSDFIAEQTHFAKGLTGVIDPIVGCAGGDNVSPGLSKSYADSFLWLCLPAHIPYIQTYAISWQCHTPLDLIAYLVTIISRTCLITADLLLVCITWVNLYWKGGLRQSLEMNRFIKVLLMDGMLVLPTMNVI